MFTGLDLPRSPYISVYLAISPHISRTYEAHGVGLVHRAFAQDVPGRYGEIFGDIGRYARGRNGEVLFRVRVGVRVGVRVRVRVRVRGFGVGLGLRLGLGLQDVPCEPLCQHGHAMDSNVLRLAPLPLCAKVVKGEDLVRARVRGRGRLEKTWPGLGLGLGVG